MGLPATEVVSVIDDQVMYYGLIPSYRSALWFISSFDHFSSHWGGYLERTSIECKPSMLWKVDHS